MDNKIIHIDMDAFYVSVEIRDNPELANKPVAVGGKSSTRGVLSTCNYIARSYGVHSAMPTHLAFLKCPELIILSGRMKSYKQVSEHLHRIFKRYTTIVEGVSLDEAYLDVSSCKLFEGSATLIAQDIRKTIFNELSLTASAGIAPLKYLAKIASDLNKPNGQYVIPPCNVITFINEMPLSKISGVGKVSFEKLLHYGFEYGKDIRASSETLLTQQFGRLGRSLWLKCQGIDTKTVEVNRIRKSIGVERTFSSDIKEIDKLLYVLNNKLIPELKKRAGNYLKLIHNVSVKIKYSDFQLTTKTCLFSEFDTNIFEMMLIKVLESRRGKSVRLVGIQLGLKESNKNTQLSLF